MAVNDIVEEKNKASDYVEINVHSGNINFFSAENSKKLQTIMCVMHAAKGDFLFWEGDPADKLYYVIQGGVRITKLSETGKSFILYLQQAGDLFGHMGPFQNNFHNYSAEATSDCEIGVIQRKDLEVLLGQCGELAIELMKWMCLMHRMTETKFRDLMMYGKTGALSSLLIRLSNSYGAPYGEHIQIDYKINNSEMADMIMSTRENVNRMLNDMRKDGAIELHTGTIIIKDIAYLRNICHCENCPLEICRM